LPSPCTITTIMKIVAALLLLISLEAVTAKECCLCDNCADVAPEKIDMITFSPFEADVVAEEGDEEGADGATTCGELAFAVLDVEDEEYCALIQEDYQEACCSSGKNVPLKFRVFRKRCICLTPIIVCFLFVLCRTRGTLRTRRRIHGILDPRCPPAVECCGIHCRPPKQQLQSQSQQRQCRRSCPGSCAGSSRRARTSSCPGSQQQCQSQPQQQSQQRQ